jgi:hypothetical protein
MIPEWNASGVLPPFVGDPKEPADMSPYWSTLGDLARRFVTSDVRRSIFRGLLQYRRELTRVGVTSGFQWFDGSYMEHIERTENRNPRDIDVVTFGHVPIPRRDTAAKRAFGQSNPNLFDPAAAKDAFFCDAYFVDLDIAPHLIVDSTRYWFGLFSHKRATHLWKGLIATPLGSDDSAAWGRVT